MFRYILGFTVVLSAFPFFHAHSQEEPDCSTTVVICVTREMASALGLCGEETSCLQELCDGERTACCPITLTIDPPPGCPSEPDDPCPIDLEDLIDQLAEEIEWDPIDISANESEVLGKLCSYLRNCCETTSSLVGGDGINYWDAINAYYFFYPDSILSEEHLEGFFEDCSSSGSCSPNNGPVPGPPDPDDWPNGVIPTDGPPRGPDAGPSSDNRGGRCDGFALSGSPDFEQFSNDPAECAGGSSIGIFNIDMFSGNWSKQSVDLALPAKGFSWIIGRTYNCMQQERDGTSFTFVHSNGMQGYDWRQDSLPELLLIENPDALYLVMNAHSFVSFGHYDDDTSSDLWVASGSKGGAAKRTVNTAGTTDVEVYEVFDLSGLKMSFFGFDSAITASKRGKLWKIEDPAGNTAYVGHETEPDTALSTGFVEVGTSTGNYAVKNVYDTSGRLYEYAYSTNPIDADRANGAHRLVSITAYPEDDNGDPFVAKVEYVYYDWITWTGVQGTSTPDTNGLPGDLKLVKVTTPTSLGDEYIVERTHYRYWTDGEDGEDDDGPVYGADGYDHAIKYIYESEGLRRADVALSDGVHTTDDVLNETLADLKVYAAQYMEYNTDSYDRRIKKVWGNGECGCGSTSAAGDGEHILAYESYKGLTSPNDSGYQPWYNRTIVTYPPATPSEPSAAANSLTKFETIYFGIGGSKVATVITEDDPTTATRAWVTLTEFDFASLGAIQYTPEAVTSYDHGTGTFTTSADGLAYEYVSWEADEVGGAGPDERNFGRTRFVKWSTDRDSVPNVQSFLSESEMEFATVSISASGDSATLAKSFPKRTQRYPEGGLVSDATGYEETEIVRDFHSAGTNGMGVLRVESEELRQPGVPTAENGNGDSDRDPVKKYFRVDGTVSWVRDADGVFSYTKFDAFNMPVWTIEDADPAESEVLGDLPSGGLTATGTPLHIKTVYVYDEQMRLTKMTLPHDRELYEHYDVLSDGRIVGLSFPRHVAGTVYGPASFSISGHNGAGYEAGALALTSSGEAVADVGDWVDQADTTAVDVFALLGSVARLSTSVYDEPGVKMIASRSYYDIDGTTGNQYDEATFAYDDWGRVVRTEAAHGTVTRTTYDDIGRVEAVWMGTNDSDFPGSSGSGDNMVKVSSTEYDDDGVGNGLVTTSTQHPDSNSANDRVTEYIYDDRNRLIIRKSPEKPHAGYEYDNLDRVLYTAMYSDVSNATLFNKDSEVSDLDDNRLSLSQSKYDTRGRVYETRTNKIDQTDGSLVGGSFVITEIWYSDVGQVIKTVGSQITKTVFDRLRRPVTQYILSSVSDTSGYADAFDVADDYVVSESHTLWDDDAGYVLAAMSVDRHPEDTTTTGALFTPSSTVGLWQESAALKGRVRILAMWYDGHDRVVQTVDYGTYGLDSDYSNTESFNRLDSGFISPPSASSLVSSQPETGHFVINTYNEDGEVEVVSVPNDETGEMSPNWMVETKTVYDDMGRLVQRVENWDGSLSPAPEYPDINRITELVYTDGLMSEQVAKNGSDNGSGGTTVESQQTEYSYGTIKGTSDSDVATGHLLQSVHYPDTAGSGDGVFYEYNALGQRKRVTDQEGNVIELSYDKRGRTTSRTVETLASGFNGDVRRIDTSYENRGMIESVEQFSSTTGTSAVDSIDFEYDGWGMLEKSSQDLDGAGGGAAFDVDYTTSIALGAASTIRRTKVDYPSGARAEYVYPLLSIDSDLSRVESVKFDTDSVGATSVYAAYKYAGRGTLLHTTLYTSGSHKYSSYYDPADPDGYAYLDEFNRPTKSFWAHLNSPDPDLNFYDVDLVYDVASNITSIDDQITGRTMNLTVDDFRRVTESEIESNSSVASSRVWDLDHLGNWRTFTYTKNSTVELLDTRDFTLANEITDRDLEIGGASAVAKDPVYDNVGNMTQDGRYYEYEYDAFGRITEVVDVTDSMTPVTVAEYSYNGMYQRTITRTDRDNSGGLDSEAYHHVYDDRWRVIEIYRKPVSGSIDAEPKELTLYHNAGVSGSSSPLDSVIARFRTDDDGDSMKSMSEDWSAEADGDMDLITWCFQNWRGDVSVTYMSGTLGTLERIEYTPYGIPKSYLLADQNLDGSVTAADYSAWVSHYNAGDALADTNFDGAVSPADSSAWTGEYNRTGGSVGGIGVLSPWLDNHIGYAGYRLTDQVLTTVWHVRYRDYLPNIGLWTSRDPIGYRGGSTNIYEYVSSNPIQYYDSYGLAKCNTNCGGGQPAKGNAPLWLQLIPVFKWPMWHDPRIVKCEPAVWQEAMKNMLKYWLRMSRECRSLNPPGGIAPAGSPLPTISCDCPHKYFPDSHTINLCPGYPLMPSIGDPEWPSAVEEEFIHALQRCKLTEGNPRTVDPKYTKPWNNPYNAMCREVVAKYYSQGKPPLTPKGIDKLCNNACDSAKDDYDEHNLPAGKKTCMTDCLSSIHFCLKNPYLTP